MNGFFFVFLFFFYSCDFFDTTFRCKLHPLLEKQTMTDDSVRVQLTCVQRGVIPHDRVTPDLNVLLEVQVETVRSLEELVSDCLRHDLTLSSSIADPTWEPRIDGRVRYLLRFSLASQGDAVRTYVRSTWPDTLIDIPDSVWDFSVQQELQQRWADVSDTRTRVGESLWQCLSPFQQTIVLRAALRSRLYIGDEMGSGKTLSSLVCAWLYRKEFPLLIVCPTSLMYNWKHEIERWISPNVSTPPTVELWKSKAHVLRARMSDVVIVSYGVLRNQTESFSRFRVVIADEAHALKNRTSSQAKAMWRLLREENKRAVFLLSGTPIPGYVEDLFIPLGILEPSLYPLFYHRTKFSFASRYCAPKPGRFGGLEYKGHEHPYELAAVLSYVMVRRLKDVLLPELPNKFRSTLVLSPLPKPKEREIQELLKKVDSQGRGDRDAFMKAWRLSCEYKIPQAKALVRTEIADLVQSDDSKRPILFFYHMKMKDALIEACEAARLSYFVIEGATSPLRRHQLVTEFQEQGKYRVAILSIKAAGVGLNITVSSHVFFLEFDWSPAVNVQAEDRTHRRGQTRDCIVVYVLLPNTTDDILMGLTNKKHRQAATVLDRDSQTTLRGHRAHDLLELLHLQAKNPNGNANGKKRKPGSIQDCRPVIRSRITNQ